MRYALAILLMTVHLFNIGGYRLFFNHLERNADLHMVQRLDNDEYDEADLIQMKVALSTPYNENQQRFERYDGAVSVNGVQYNYVKRRIANDTLYVLCIPNMDRMKLNNAKDQFFTMVNDLIQQNNKSEHPVKPQHQLLKSETNEYQPVENDIAFIQMEIFKVKYFLLSSSMPDLIWQDSPFQPPRC
ncbi:MAG: hypothetical protein ACO29O_05265 [Chitinophagaceae bacterium]